MHSANYAMAICLSVTRRYSVETAKYILKLFSPSGSPTNLVYLYQTGWLYSAMATPLTGASNARKYEKITIFDQCLALSRK